MIHGAAALPVWVLTLPYLELRDTELSDAWKDPASYPGGWDPRRNKHAVAVFSQYELEARTLAAADCRIWLDPDYAFAKRLNPTEPTVILSAGGSAENE